jgi:hypothetical protein
MHLLSRKHEEYHETIQKQKTYAWLLCGLQSLIYR